MRKLGRGAQGGAGSLQSIRERASEYRFPVSQSLPQLQEPPQVSLSCSHFMAGCGTQLFRDMLVHNANGNGGNRTNNNNAGREPATRDAEKKVRKREQKLREMADVWDSAAVTFVNT
jgi:hypothetical protein